MGRVAREKKRDLSKRRSKDDGREAVSLAESRKYPFNNALIHCLLIVGIGILAYSNSFTNPFQWDENLCIVQNPVVKNLAYFFDPSRAKPDDPEGCPVSRTRYIGYLTFAINYQLHGLDVLGYHIFNLAIHLLNALLVFLLIRLTFKTPFLEGAFLKSDSSLIALFSALIFVSHPLQSEAVTYIFQRFASLVTFFCLSALVFYIQWRLYLDEKKASNFKSTFYLIASLVSTVCAMFTKENAFTFPLVILVYEFFFLRGRRKTRVIRLLPWILSMAIIPLTVIGANKSTGEMVSQIPLPYRGELSKEAYLFTQFRVILTYVRLLFLPAHQNLDYDYPVYHSFFTPEVLLSFLFHLAFIGLAFYLFYRSRGTIQDLRLSSFGILWFFVTLSMESSIIPLINMICEYRVYLPSIGWVMTIMTSAWIALEKLKPRFPGIRKPVIGWFVLIVILFSVLTYARNGVWRDEIRLWEDVVAKSPDKSRGHFALGLALAKKSRFDEAIREFQTSLKLDPKQAKVHMNLATIYVAQAKLEDALKEYEIALTIDPKDSTVHYNLGILLAQIQRLDEAVREFQMTLKLNPYDASAHNNLGAILAQQGRLDEATKEFKTALEIEPDYVKARRNLAKIRDLQDSVPIR